jgi:hypothetical protein
MYVQIELILNTCSIAWLPDGTFSSQKSQLVLPGCLFSYQKSQFGEILEGHRMENIGILYDHLEYFTAIWYGLWTFGIVCGHLVYVSCFGMFVPSKIWQPWFTVEFSCPRHS